MKLELSQPEWARFLYEPGTYKILSGGRGSGKSYAIIFALLVLGMRKQEKILLARDTMKSLEDSSFSMLRTVAQQYEVFTRFYDFRTSRILSKNGTQWLFKGVSSSTSTAGSIRSIDGITITFVEEAQFIKEKSWREMIPSVMRTPGCKFFAAFNPTSRLDPVYKVATDPTRVGVDVEHKKINYDQNPYFPLEMERERLAQKRLDPQFYLHDWEGELNDAAITVNRVLPAHLVDLCIEAYRHEYETGDYHAGYDIADEGYDYNAYAERRGPVVTHLEKWSGVGSTIGLSSKKVSAILEQNEVEMLYYDSTGAGAAAKSTFAEIYGKNNSKIRPFAFNKRVAAKERPYTSGLKQREAFNNRFSQVCWSVRLRAENTKRLLAGENVHPNQCLFFHPSLQDIPGFMEQMITPIYDYDNKQLKVNKYGEQEKDSRRSPDLFDAMMLSFVYDSRNGIKLVQKDSDEAI